MRNFIQPGDVITLSAPYDVLSGAGVLVGSLFGIAAYSALTGAEVETKMSGVFDMPKLAAQAWTVGAPIYWDATNKQTTTVSTSNTLIGKAVLVAANPSDTGRVRLSAN
ncbi:DUF2190 family protein [Rhizobium tumorigenes]|uniref:DUF2190 family protein n=1 Tax=Rhizobium tumorigenes TaxID=2041385 RepID=UPI00241CAFEB|nr:DUF2190 family protein [Rhizobium tumorigenes]WFS02779.1 DUF2190 family protein [Rhizobium tumorigenes]